MPGFNELPYDICRAIISTLVDLHNCGNWVGNPQLKLSPISTISRHWQDVVETIIWRQIRIYGHELEDVSEFICPHRRSLIEHIEFVTRRPISKAREKEAEPGNGSDTSWMGDFPAMLRSWELQSPALARPFKKLSLVVRASSDAGHPGSPANFTSPRMTDYFSTRCGCWLEDDSTSERKSSQRRAAAAKGSLSTLAQVMFLVRSSQPPTHQFDATRDILRELLRPWPPNLADLEVDFSNEGTPNPLCGQSSQIDFCRQLHEYSQNLTSLTLMGQFQAIPDLFWPTQDKCPSENEGPQWPQLTRLIIHACSQDETWYFYIPEQQRQSSRANSIGSMSSDSMEEHPEDETRTPADRENAKLDIQKLYLSLALALPRMPKLGLLAVLDYPGIGLTWQSSESRIAHPFVKELGQYAPRLDFWGKHTIPDNYVVQTLKDATTTISEKEPVVIGLHDDPLAIAEILWLGELSWAP